MRIDERSPEMSPRGSTPHTLTSFGEALASLHDDTLMMAGLAERGLDNAMACLLQARNDRCNIAIADDEEIDALEKKISQDGVDLLTRFQPVASDLRQVVASIRLSGNVERVGDQAVKIARRTRRLTADPSLIEIQLLQQPWTEARALFADSVRAYAEADVQLARTIRDRDRKLDEMNQLLASELTAAMAAAPDYITDYLNLLFIGRHLERVGDHAKNIAEETIYVHQAEDIRHLNNRFSDTDLT
jgi:phosphate transport system protein